MTPPPYPPDVRAVLVIRDKGRGPVLEIVYPDAVTVEVLLTIATAVNDAIRLTLAVADAEKQ